MPHPMSRAFLFGKDSRSTRAMNSGLSSPPMYHRSPVWRNLWYICSHGMLTPPFSSFTICSSVMRFLLVQEEQERHGHLSLPDLLHHSLQPLQGVAHEPLVARRGPALPEHGKHIQQWPLEPQGIPCSRALLVGQHSLHHQKVVLRLEEGLCHGA